MEARETRLLGAQRDRCGARAARRAARWSGCRRRSPGPAPPCSWCSTAWAGRRSPASPAGSRSSRPSPGDRSPRWCRPPRPPRSPRSPPGCRRRATASPASASAHEKGVLNAIRWQLADGGRAARARARADGSGCSAGARCRSSPRPMFRTTGFTAAHLRGAEFHGWQTTVGARRARAGAGRRRRAVRLRLLPGRRRGRARLRARVARSTRPSSPPPTGSSVTLLDALPDDVALVVTADHGQVQVGPDGWSRARRRCTAGRDLRGRRSLPLPARASPARAASCHAAARGAARRRRVGVPARAAARRGLARPRPGAGGLPARRRRRARGARGPSGFVDPTLPHEAQPDVGATARSPRPRWRSRSWPSRGRSLGTAR